MGLDLRISAPLHFAFFKDPLYHRLTFLSRVVVFAFGSL